MKQLKTYIGYALWLALAACSSDEAPIAPPAEKEPLMVTASVDGSLPTASTRAAGAVFATGDQIVAYLQHVKGESNEVVSGFSKTFTFTPSIPDSEGKYTLSATTSGPYWDDFSESTADGSKDIRSDGHGVRSFYAYCLNGGTATALDEATGVLSWTVQQDQSSAEALKKSDLLWSKTQDKVTYVHAKESREGLTLPFTHAMSKVSITVKAGEGYSDNVLDATVVKLNDMLTSASVNLPSSQITSATGQQDITMCGESASSDGKERTFHAIVMPGSKFTQGKVLAIIENVKGNDYEVKVTSNMLEQSAWGSQYDESTGAKSGVHYQLTVTINKQKIDVVATLTDWTSVLSEAIGKILFTGDITNAGVTNSITTEGSTFGLYYKKDGESNYITSFGWTYNSTANAWSSTTPLYWENGTDAYYFRALAKWINDTQIESANLSDPYTASQGSDDILWATTPAYTWNSTPIEKGGLIHPRTGPVPLCFEHALSKVTVKLLTSAEDKQKVNLKGATVTISPLYTQGKISIEDGSIDTSSETASNSLTYTMPTTDASEDKHFTSLTIPQQIGDGVKLQVTLSDNTTYSIRLKDCMIKGTETPITAWQRGNYYTYEITLNKEAISFVAYVKKWEETTGSGDATLDWD